MAIKFEKIKPGMKLWDVRKKTSPGGGKWSTWPVYVKEVDKEKRLVLASWNGNPASWMSERKITGYRAKRPE